MERRRLGTAESRQEWGTRRLRNAIIDRFAEQGEISRPESCDDGGHLGSLMQRHRSRNAGGKCRAAIAGPQPVVRAGEYDEQIGRDRKSHDVDGVHRTDQHGAAQETGRNVIEMPPRHCFLGNEAAFQQPISLEWRSQQGINGNRTGHR
jgi:hypothetical protein